MFLNLHLIVRMDVTTMFHSFCRASERFPSTLSSYCPLLLLRLFQRFVGSVKMFKNAMKNYYSQE